MRMLTTLRFFQDSRWLDSFHNGATRQPGFQHLQWHQREEAAQPRFEEVPDKVGSGEAFLHFPDGTMSEGDASGAQPHLLHPDLMMASSKRNNQPEHGPLQATRRASLEEGEDGAAHGHASAIFYGGEFVRGGQSKAEDATKHMMAAYERSRILQQEMVKQEAYARGSARIDLMED